MRMITRVLPVMISTLTLTLALASGTGCGDDDSGNQNNTNDWEQLSENFVRTEAGPADYGCMSSPDPALTFDQDTDITGIVEDFEMHDPVAGIEVTIYATRADLIADIPFDVSAPSASDGSYTLLAPAHTQRVHYKMIDPTGENFFDTIELEDPVAGMGPGAPTTTGKDRAALSLTTVDTVQLTLGMSRIPGRGIIAGTVYDCLREHVAQAGMRVYNGPASDPNRQLISIWSNDTADRNSFYFRDGMPSRLQSFTELGGQILVANLVASTPVTIEIWGRMEAAQSPEDCSEGCLIATQEVPVMADTVVITDLNPLYSN
jgi:hypothetical protein